MVRILLLFSFVFCQDIGFVGDSITKSGYNILVEQSLEYETYNFGISGIMVTGDFNYKNTQEFQDVLDLEPEFIVMLLGTNDVRIYNESLFFTEYNWLIDSFNSVVLLCTIPYQLNKPESDNTIDTMNNKIMSIGLNIIDINSALGLNQDYFFEDGLHPNSKGRQIMADEVIKAFNSLSAEPEYWETVKDYEEQKKLSWFGCQK